jgi:hypothetical protein
MVNELRELMGEASARPPQDHTDLGAVIAAGRRRVRVGRVAMVGATALATGAIALGSMAWIDPAPADLTTAGVPRPEGPTVRLTEATPAVEGQDYRELSAYTNEDLDSDNGEYYHGVTDDGLVLFQEGQTATRPEVRYALMDPASGEKDWLPTWPGGGEQAFPIELGTDRVVLLRFEQASANGLRSRPVLDVLDRTTRTWRTVSWPGLPASEDPSFVSVGPDGRAYVAVVTDPGAVPEGGWPMGPDGEADDADAEGDVSRLWSMSLTDPSDVRDEGLAVGDFAFDGDRLVWTDSSNGAAGRVHVRDLATGEESSFDPQLGEKCNLLGFDVEGGRIAMSQYCGTYEGGVRDDRVQVVTTEGEQVVTVQDDGVEGGQLVAGGDYLTMTAYDRATGGTYLYDFEEGRLLRVSDGMSSWTVAHGPTPGDQFFWTTPTGASVPGFGSKGATGHLGEIIR